MIELRQFASIGRSLVATQNFIPGETVVTDRAVLRWDGAASPLPPVFEAGLQKYSTVNRGLAAAIHEFVRRADDPAVQRCVFDLHCPDLPVSRAASELYNFCRDIAAEHPTLSAISASDRLPAKRCAEGDVAVLLTYVAMAAKVNAHRASNGDWCIFAVASKLAHSCEPNLFFLPSSDSHDQCRFVAIRHIQAGEALSFSYLGGPGLLLPTPLRQERLKMSHLFVCRCRRCEGPDYGRQFRCPNGCGGVESLGGLSFYRLAGLPPCIVRRSSPLLVTDDDAFPDQLWSCRNCGVKLSDADLKATLLEEKKLDTDVAAVNPQNYKHSVLRELTLEVAAVMGYAHASYAAMVGHMCNYFRLMVTQGLVNAFPVFMCWSARYIDALAMQRVVVEDAKQPVDFPHMLTAAAVLSIVATFAKASPTDATRFGPVVRQLAKCVLNMVNALYPHDPRREMLAALAESAEEFDVEGKQGPTLIAVILRWWPDEGPLRDCINCPRNDLSHSVTASEHHSLVGLFDMWSNIVAAQHIRQALQ